MLRKLVCVVALGGIAGTVLLVGCTKSPEQPSGREVGKIENLPTSATPAPEHAATEDGNHGHKQGAHGGIIVSLGRDSYHVEAIVTEDGQLRLHTLGNDETRVIDVQTQDLIAYVKIPNAVDSTTVEVRASAQPGDAEGKASLFVGRLPEALVGQKIEVTIPSMTIGGERFRLGFTTKTESHESEPMPTKVANEAETQLYLTAGGTYTQADIEANGNITASQKFAGFQAAHDLKPKVGDKLCPVTRTKASPNCVWIIGGESYEFCCPPCVDEFVALAKSSPEQVKPPDQYIKRGSADDTDL